MELKINFTSPIREYVAQKLQISFKFGRGYAAGKVKTFGSEEARYKVCKVKCYDIEARKKIFSSSWYEVRDTHLDDSVDGEEVFCGDKDELADFLLELDELHESFSYKGGKEGNGGKFDVFVYKDLGKKDIRSLDGIIKKKLNALPYMKL
ncbi:MAG: hypothetical protein AABX05_05205 [Nanoarchaeota archaeon]